MPTLQEQTRQLESAITNVRRAAANYSSVLRQMQAEFERQNGPYLESIARVPVAGSIPGGAYIGLMQNLSRPVGQAARLVEQARAQMANVATALHAQASSLAGRVSQAFSEKDAQWVAVTLQDAAQLDQQAQTLLEAHQRSRYGQNDPAETPLVLYALGPRLPSDGRTWSEGAYAMLVGREYAELHPLPPPSQEQPGNLLGSLASWGGIIAGVIGGVLVVRWLRGR